MKEANTDATGGVIPYKNVPALIGYYCGVFSLIPLLGLPLSVVAIALGIWGLAKKSQHPEAKGTAHAFVAIFFGLISLLLYGGGLIFLIVAS